MKKTIYRTLIELTNRRFLALAIKAFAESKLSKPFVPSFVRTYRINTDEMEYSVGEYQTLHELFTRKLKPGLRMTDPDPSAAACPVDGILEEQGEIGPEAVFTVKGLDYSIAEMLGSEENAAGYKGGYYLIIYLSPSHYHRIHSPVSGTIRKQFELGDKSYPVNRLGLKYGKYPLSKNYRLVTEIETEQEKKAAVVKVGAMNINTIQTAKQDGYIGKGQELALFSFGSTVVLLFEPGVFKPAAGEEVQEVKEVKAGQTIGFLI
ncbi:phosphatidylserine decarboxylase [Bacillus marinisedimentorum]|uniref:phosphatidylserine decarboxylase n=1 Tax=Bacillus marinisedimentorum TaxID=1821260 RepID=UPI0008727CC2|nr:phosphatidylserine decarboxylase [Bacillus marinisedimentorum]